MFTLMFFGVIIKQIIVIIKGWYLIMDVFISYRRSTGFVYADHIYKFLKDNNFDVFLDTKGLYQHAGKFPKILEESIAKANDFILILSDLNIDDYEKSVYIQEILTAMKLNKNIIVVSCNNFVFPVNLYKPLEELPTYNALIVNDMSYFTGNFFNDLLAKMTSSELTKQAYNKLNVITKLESRNIVENNHPLSERLNKDVVSVDICAMACQGILVLAREYLQKILDNNCKIRVVINNPDSPSAQEACTMKISSGGLRQRKRIIPDSYNYMLDWYEENPEQFDCKITDLYLPCAIMIVRYKDSSKDTIKVDYYSFNCDDRERRCVLISCGDYENFSFYEKQFEWIWNNSNKVETEGLM